MVKKHTLSANPLKATHSETRQGVSSAFVFNVDLNIVQNLRPAYSNRNFSTTLDLQPIGMLRQQQQFGRGAGSDKCHDPIRSMTWACSKYKNYLSRNVSHPLEMGPDASSSQLKQPEWETSVRWEAVAEKRLSGQGGREQAPSPPSRCWGHWMMSVCKGRAPGSPWEEHSSFKLPVMQSAFFWQYNYNSYKYYSSLLRALETSVNKYATKQTGIKLRCGVCCRHFKLLRMTVC